MDIVLGSAYLLLSMVLPWVAARRKLTTHGTWPFLFILGSVLFFVPLQVLGLSGLLFDYPALTLSSALTGIVLVSLPLAVFLYRLPLQDRTQEVHVERKIDRPVLLLALVVVSVFGLAGILLSFGYPRGFEVHAYHLPIALNIFQTGSLEFWGDAYMLTFPANASLYYGFLLQWLPERIVAASNLPLLLAAGMACYVLSSAVGADRNGALLASLGLLSIPIFSFSGIELGADVAGAAYIGLAAYFIVSRPEVPGGWPILAGLAAGLSFGFKTLNLIPISMLFLVVVLPLGLAPRQSTWSKRLLDAVRYSLAALLAGGAWLLRSYLETGNPLYPVHFSPVFDYLGWPAAPDFVLDHRQETELEWVDSPSGWLTYPWVEGQFINQHYKHSSGLGGFFASAVPPAMLLASLSAFGLIKKNGTARHDVSKNVVFALGVALLLIWWTLGDRQPRYAIPAIVFLVPISGWMLTNLSAPWRRRIVLTWTTGILVMMVILAERLVVEIGGRILQYPEVRRFEVLEYPQEIDRFPSGTVVLNGLSRVSNYKCFGARLDNRVIGASRAKSLFYDEERSSWVFNAENVGGSSVDYVYLLSDADWLTEDGVELTPIRVYDTNPYNGKKLPTSSTLYRVEMLSLDRKAPADRTRAEAS